MNEMTLFRDAEEVLAFIPKCRALGVVQFSDGAVSFVLGQLPTADAPATTQKEQPGDALDVALRLRGTRPDEKQTKDNEKKP